MEDIIRRILNARVYDVAERSKLDHARKLSEELKNTVLIKREDQQPVFSFKLRGAYNKIVKLSAAERNKGVIAASAGNHAQGVALAAAKLSCRAVIVMPETTPSIKVQAVQALGGETVLVGENYDAASAHAHKLADEQGLHYIPPYDDPDVIAGQGTVAVELLQQWPDELHAVFIAVGGGGLAAGMASYIRTLRPETRIIAVEAAESACLAAAMQAGERVVLPEVGLFADGVAVKQIGLHPFALLKDLVDEVITVSTDEICAAVRDAYVDLRATLEPAGALGLAGLKQYVSSTGIEEKNLATVATGANVNFDRLRHIAERAETGARREALIAVTIPEQPGSFRSFCQQLGDRQITEFNYRYAAGADAHVFAGVRLTNGDTERHEIIENLQQRDYPVTDLTHNEMAKIHIRYMVGGRAAAGNERLFRFEFPERPGALLKFLNNLSAQWNISLFHYRNHGAEFGRVLAAVQLPKAENQQLNQALDRLAYPYTEETENPAYQLFLG